MIDSKKIIDQLLLKATTSLFSGSFCKRNLSKVIAFSIDHRQSNNLSNLELKPTEHDVFPKRRDLHHSSKQSFQSFRYVGDHGKILICESTEKRRTLLEQGYQVTQGGHLVRGLLGGADPNGGGEDGRDGNNGNEKLNTIYSDDILPEFESGLKQVGIELTEKMNSGEGGAIPSCAVCYAWGKLKNKKMVREKLYPHLDYVLGGAAGQKNAFLDENDNRINEISHFIGTMQNADRVLLVATPEVLWKYEKGIVRKETFKGVGLSEDNTKTLLNHLRSKPINVIGAVGYLKWETDMDKKIQRVCSDENLPLVLKGNGQEITEKLLDVWKLYEEDGSAVIEQELSILQNARWRDLRKRGSIVIALIEGTPQTAVPPLFQGLPCINFQEGEFRKDELGYLYSEKEELTGEWKLLKEKGYIDTANGTADLTRDVLKKLDENKEELKQELGSELVKFLSHARKRSYPDHFFRLAENLKLEGPQECQVLEEAKKIFNDERKIILANKLKGKNTVIRLRSSSSPQASEVAEVVYKVKEFIDNELLTLMGRIDDCSRFEQNSNVQMTEVVEQCLTLFKATEIGSFSTRKLIQLSQMLLEFYSSNEDDIPPNSCIPQMIAQLLQQTIIRLGGRRIEKEKVTQLWEGLEEIRKHHDIETQYLSLYGREGLKGISYQENASEHRWCPEWIWHLFAREPRAEQEFNRFLQEAQGQWYTLLNPKYEMLIRQEAFDFAELTKEYEEIEYDKNHPWQWSYGILDVIYKQVNEQENDAFRTGFLNIVESNQGRSNKYHINFHNNNFDWRICLKAQKVHYEIVNRDKAHTEMILNRVKTIIDEIGKLANQDKRTEWERIVNTNFRNFEQQLKRRN